MSPLAFVLLFGYLYVAEGKNWVLLAAGSNTYMNYRHQADICHAYHIVRGHGVPEENIVTMMYDDIADNTDNPYPGNIINHPDGTNLYPGVVIDYSKEEVTPEVFLAVLTGNATGVEQLIGRKGKVINSGSEDHVFVNFVDHGAPGLLAFPDGVLKARDLEDAIKQMYSNNQFKKMVFYVEACESGSMFSNLLPDDIDVFVTTAANPDESSYACYYDGTRNTFLGDLYSVNWMEDSDKSMGSMTVAEFQGNQRCEVCGQTPRLRHPSEDAVRSEKVHLTILEKKFRAAKQEDEKKAAAEKLNKLLDLYANTDQFFKDVVNGLAHRQQSAKPLLSKLLFQKELYNAVVHQRQEISQWDCYEAALDAIMFVCPGMKLPQNDYALRHLYMMVNLCEMGHSSLAMRSAISDASMQPFCDASSE